MKLLSIFKPTRSAKASAFAQSLADDIAKRYPPELDRNPTKHLSANRLTRILEDTCEKAADYQRDNRLGVFGKAKLGNAFKWALTDLGYRKEFVDIATEALIVYVSKKQ